MSGKNIVELPANQEIDGTKAFEASFSPLAVHEVLLEFDPKHSGPPLCRFSNEQGGTQELHMLPQRGRDGRFSNHVAGGAKWSKVSVTTLRNVKARLVKVKLIGKVEAPAANV
jgi:hypothetical protein